MNKILTILALLMLFIVPLALGRAVEKQIATPTEFNGPSTGSYSSSSAIGAHFPSNGNQKLCRSTGGRWHFVISPSSIDESYCDCSTDAPSQFPKVWNENLGCISIEQLCEETGGEWTGEETPIDHPYCDCSQISNDKWKWHPVKGCTIVIQEETPIDWPTETQEEESSSSSDNDGKFTSGKGYTKNDNEQEATEETALEEQTNEEIVEETTEQNGFLNQITGYVTGYNQKMKENASYFLYPTLAILLVGLVIFGVREIKF